MVDNSHRCHPTFYVHRQSTTYDSFLTSIEQTIETGERDHGIQYVSLAASSVPCLQKRIIQNGELDSAP
jgi:hypothetical protein